VLLPGSPTGDALWDDWDTPPCVPSASMLHLDGFDGPIDLLLDQAEWQRLDLGRISLTAPVEQFVAALAQLAPYTTIERLAEWLVLAARLVLLPSRLLFSGNTRSGRGGRAEREVTRLDELRFIRAVAAWLQARPHVGHDAFACAPPGRGPLFTSYMALMEACLVVLKSREGRPETEPVYRPVIPELWRVSDALARIRALLLDYPEEVGLAVFLPPMAADETNRPLKARAAVGSSLMAGLELARDGVIQLDKKRPLGSVIARPIAAARQAQEERAPVATTAA
jgi:segregation and condensation protein A